MAGAIDQGVRALPGALATLAERTGVAAACGSPAGAGWVRLDVLAACEQQLGVAVRRASAGFGTGQPAERLGATWLVGEVATLVAWPAATALLTAGVTLAHEPRHVHLPDPAGPRRLAVQLDGPVRAATPGLVGTAICDAVRPLVEAVHLRTGRGRRALWGTVTDAVAAGFLAAGATRQLQPLAQGLAEAVVHGTSDLVGTTNWHATDGVTRHVRNVCCRWDAQPGGQLCTTCPRAATSVDRVDRP